MVRTAPSAASTSATDDGHASFCWNRRYQHPGRCRAISRCFSRACHAVCLSAYTVSPPLRAQFFRAELGAWRSPDRPGRSASVPRGCPCRPLRPSIQHDDLIRVADGADALGHDESWWCRCSCSAKPRRAALRRCGSPARRRNRRTPGFPACGPAPGRWKAAASGRRTRCVPHCGDVVLRCRPGSLSTNSAGLRQLQRLPDAVIRRLAAALAEEHVVPDVAGEQHRLLGHIADAGRTARRRCSPSRSRPSTSTSPAGRVVEPGGIRLTSVDLAAAGRADDGHAFRPA